MGLRDLFGRYLPSWLADNFPASPSYGYRFLWVFHAFVDSEIDRMLQGSLAAVGRGTPTALKYIGQARGIIKGRYDTDAQYVAKLRTWIDRHKERGNQRRLAREIWEYLGDDGSGASRVRVVNRSGWWVTINPDGSLSETQATFDWDSVSHPERSDPDEPWWSDLFVIIYPSWTFRTGTLGDLTGADGFALGHMAPIEQVDDVKSIVRQWKAGHECVRCVIWTTDTAKFDPAVPLSNPDGTWGGWGGVGSGSRVASGRDLTTCRFWEPGCRDREQGPRRPPTSLLGLFGAALKHRWDSYAAGVWTDSVSGANGVVGIGTPIQRTVNGHTYPEFNGNDNGLIGPDIATLNDLTSWTVAYAVKTNDTDPTSAYGSIIDHQTQFYIEQTSGGFIAPSSYDSGGITGTVPINTGTWKRVVITCNGTFCKAYVNGVLDGTCTWTGQEDVSGSIGLGCIGTANSRVPNAGIAIIVVATRGLSGLEAGWLDDILTAHLGES